MCVKMRLICLGIPQNMVSQTEKGVVECYLMIFLLVFLIENARGSFGEGSDV